MRFVDLDTALFGVGVLDVVTIGLLTGGLHAASKPETLGKLRGAAIAAALLALLPFAGSVLMLAHGVLRELTLSAWQPSLSNAYLHRNVVYGVALLLLGGLAMSPPAIAVLITTLRLRSAKQQQALDWRELQRLALWGGGIVALKLVSAWQLGAWPALPFAALALALPGGLATLNVHRAAQPRVQPFTDPSRFPATPTAPPPPIPPANLQA